MTCPAATHRKVPFTRPDGGRLNGDLAEAGKPLGAVVHQVPFFREHAVADDYGSGFDGPGKIPMRVHGQVTAAQAAPFNERLQRLAQDFAQQHPSGHRQPAADKPADAMLIGLRSGLFAPLRALLRNPT